MKGAKHAADAEHASVAAHAYVGSESTLQDLVATFECININVS